MVSQPGAEERRDGLGMGIERRWPARQRHEHHSNVPVQVSNLTGVVAIAGG